jgi:hypothetical protein
LSVAQAKILRKGFVEKEKKYVAHIREDGTEQTLEELLRRR